MILKKNLRFKQLKQTEKARLRLVISSIKVGVFAKTDDELYVSGTIKMYSYFLFVFSTVPKKVQLLKILKVMQLLWKSLPPPCKNGREENKNFFGQSLLHPVVFQKRTYQVFWSIFGSCSLQLLLGRLLIFRFFLDSRSLLGPPVPPLSPPPHRLLISRSDGWQKFFCSLYFWNIRKLIWLII